MKKQLFRTKNGTAIIALALLMFVSFGCGIFGGEENADANVNANTNANTKEKVERKKYTLEDAKNSKELVNALKSFSYAGSKNQLELVNPDEVDGFDRYFKSAIAEARLKYSGSPNPTYLVVAKFSSNAEALDELTEREKSVAAKTKRKPIKGEKNGVTTLIWFNEGNNNFLQCKKEFCFEAYGKPNGSKLEDSFEPLTVITPLRDKI